MMSWVVLRCQGSKGTWGSWDRSQDHCWEGYQVGESPHLLRYLQFVPETDFSVPLLLTWETHNMTQHDMACTRHLYRPAHISGQEICFFSYAEYKALSGEHPPPECLRTSLQGLGKVNLNTKQMCHKGGDWAGTRKTKVSNHILTASTTHSD